MVSVSREPVPSPGLSPWRPAGRNWARGDRLYNGRLVACGGKAAPRGHNGTLLRPHLGWSLPAASWPPGGGPGRPRPRPKPAPEAGPGERPGSCWPPHTPRRVRATTCLLAVVAGHTVNEPSLLCPPPGGQGQHPLVRAVPRRAGPQEAEPAPGTISPWLLVIWYRRLYDPGPQSPPRALMAMPALR